MGCSCSTTLRVPSGTGASKIPPNAPSPSSHASVKPFPLLPVPSPISELLVPQLSVSSLIDAALARISTLESAPSYNLSSTSPSSEQLPPTPSDPDQISNSIEPCSPAVQDDPPAPTLDFDFDDPFGIESDMFGGDDDDDSLLPDQSSSSSSSSNCELDMYYDLLMTKLSPPPALCWSEIETLCDQMLVLVVSKNDSDSDSLRLESWLYWMKSRSMVFAESEFDEIVVCLKRAITGRIGNRGATAAAAATAAAVEGIEGKREKEKHDVVASRWSVEIAELLRKTKQREGIREEIVEVLNQAVELWPENVDAWRLLAEVGVDADESIEENVAATAVAAARNAFGYGNFGDFRSAEILKRKRNQNELKSPEEDAEDAEIWEEEALILAALDAIRGMDDGEEEGETSAPAAPETRPPLMVDRNALPVQYCSQVRYTVQSIRDAERVLTVNSDPLDLTDTVLLKRFGTDTANQLWNLVGSFLFSPSREHYLTCAQEVDFLILSESEGTSFRFDGDDIRVEESGLVFDPCRNSDKVQMSQTRPYSLSQGFRLCPIMEESELSSQKQIVDCLRRLDSPSPTTSSAPAPSESKKFPSLAVLASRGMWPDLRSELREFGKNEFHPTVNEMSKLGNSALHLAIIANKRALCRSLLRHGADPNRLNSWGATPLHVCISFGRADLIPLLVGAGANPFVLDSQELNVMLYAEKMERRHLLNRLQL